MEQNGLGMWQRNQAIAVKLNRIRVASLIVGFFAFLAGFPALIFWFANGSIYLKPAAFWLTITTAVFLVILHTLTRKYKSLRFELTTPVWLRISNWTAIMFFPLGQHENGWHTSCANPVTICFETCKLCSETIGVNDLSAFCPTCKNPFHYRCIDFNNGCDHCKQQIK